MLDGSSLLWELRKVNVRLELVRLCSRYDLSPVISDHGSRGKKAESWTAASRDIYETDKRTQEWADSQGKDMLVRSASSYVQDWKISKEPGCVKDWSMTPSIMTLQAEPCGRRICTALFHRQKSWPKGMPKSIAKPDSSSYRLWHQ